MSKKLSDSKEFIGDLLSKDDIVFSIRQNLEELISLIPEINHMVGFEHKHPHHNKDVWEHTLYALSLSPKDFEVRLALLLHDIGKPFCYTEDENIRHFHGHANVSCSMTTDILKRLGYDNNFIKRILKIVKYHDTVITPEDIKEDYNLTYKRYCVQKCDALAHNPLKNKKRVAYLQQTENLFKQYQNLEKKEDLGIENI